MAHFKSLTALALISILATTAKSEPLMVDSFESGDMSATNSDGFEWGRNNRTSVVTKKAVVYNNGNKNVTIPSGRNWDPKSGEHSLRFRYSAGSPMTEQRFNLGKHYNDLWLTYWLKVPLNFTQGSKNNKFLSLWPSNYDRAGTVTWQTRPNGTGGANLVYQDGGVTSRETGSTPFISVPESRGRWMHIAVHVRASSGPTANDGTIQLFRKWAGENTYTKIHEKLNADTWDSISNKQGISKGYIMGWANDPYDINTEWLLDDFAIHTESPISNINSGKRPNSPVLDIQ